MYFRSSQFTLPALLVLIAWTFNPPIAMGQYDDRQCASLINQMAESQKANSFKRVITLARQLATYCRESSYALALSALATGLNGDNQHE
jgi:hypothetical protein